MDAAKALAEKKTGIPAGHILISATHAYRAHRRGCFSKCPDEAYAKSSRRKSRAVLRRRTQTSRRRKVRGEWDRSQATFTTGAGR